MKHVVVGLISRIGKDGHKQFLLVNAKKDFGKYTGCWYPPGGHVEEGEDEKEALIREIKEELNLQTEPVKKLAESPSDVPNQTTLWWTCKLLSQEMLIDVDELGGAGWFTEEEIRGMPLWPATKEFFEKYIFKTAVE